MKPFPSLRSFSPEKAAALVAFSLFGLNAHAATQPGPVAAVPPAVTGASAAPLSAPIAPEEDIIDIRGPIHIPPTLPWLAWSASAVAAAGLGFGTWALFRPRTRRKHPYELALEKLEATRPFMQLKNAQPFSRAVSEIVRLFIEECFPVRAAHRTTNEFLHDLLNLPDSPLATHRETLANFLKHCDLAKFARWTLTVPQMESMLVSAAAFVVDIGKPKTAKQAAGTPPRPAAAPVTAHS